MIFFLYSALFLSFFHFLINISVFAALRLIYSVEMISLSDEEISISYSFSSNVIVLIAHFDKNSIETILCLPSMVSMCLIFAGFETKGLAFEWTEFINSYRSITMDYEFQILDSFRCAMGWMNCDMLFLRSDFGDPFWANTIVYVYAIITTAIPVPMWVLCLHCY